MPVLKDIEVTGIPGYVPDEISEELRARLAEALQDFLFRAGMKNLNVTVGTKIAETPENSELLPVLPSGQSSGGGSNRPTEEATVEERSQQYVSRKPLFDFDFLVIDDDARESLLSAVDLVRVEKTVFDLWNLRSIEPFPRAALNFHGPPGTGKTLAAHAVADYLKKPILLASYAQVESKYVGDGSKNVEAVFYAAERDGSVLFIDEADSLLSKRLTDVTQGAEQAINSMRSQLLICLERYKGVVIFSTNLVENYDRAFETRMRHVRFEFPNQDERARIWERHLPEQLPLQEDINIEKLAEVDDICGRDIKNAVIDAALRAARSEQNRIEQVDLIAALERVKASRLP